MINNEPKQYLWVQPGRAPVILTDVLGLYRNPDFSADTDKIYELGPEVKLELSIRVNLAKPVFRNGTNG